MPIWFALLFPLLLTPWVAGAVEDASPPLGHPDFYPSPERPVGYRGDGLGCFPGATPVSEWWEDDPQPAPMTYQDKYGTERKATGWLFPGAGKPGSSKNIAWKSATSSWGNNAPIVVGDRVFCSGEPYGLYCFDVHTGKQLWAREADPWTCAGLPADKARRLHDMYMIYLVASDFYGMSFVDRKLNFTAADYAVLAEAYTTRDGPGLVERLTKLDPGMDYAAAFTSTSDLIKEYAPKVGDKAAYEKAKNAAKGFHQFIEKRIKAIGGMHLPMAMPWGTQMGFCMSTPISDGKHVYLSTGHGQTACFDLDGKMLWGRWFPRVSTDKATGDTVRSPMISGATVITVNASDHWGTKSPRLRGLHAETGELKWEAEVEVGGIGSDIVTTLGQGAAAETVVVGMRGWVVRVRDGKQIGTIPYVEASGGKNTGRSGPSMLAVADPQHPGTKVVWMAGASDNSPRPIITFRLGLDASGALTAETLWRQEKPPGYGGCFVLSGATLMFGRSQVLDVLTGAAVGKGIPGYDGDGQSAILAGKFFIFTEEQNQVGSHWGGRRPDGLTSKQFFVYDISDPAKPVSLAKRNVLGGANWPQVPWFAQYAPVLTAHPAFFGQWGGRPGHLMHLDSGMTAAGNRLFIRTVGHLYCIGDPAVAFTGRKTAP